ncbi:hypothetical protein Tco_0780094 [Tanacetum coccineum]
MASMKYCDKHNQVGFLKKPKESTWFAKITATATTFADGTLELRATIDTLEYTITEASVRIVAVDQSARHADQVVTQPSPSEPLPFSSPPPVISATTESERTPDPTHPHVAEDITMTVDDLLQLVPRLITKVDSLEKELKQTKLTMGKAIVKLVKKVKKMSIIKDKSEDFETPTQGKTSGEANISPGGLEAAETLAKVLTQRTKTYTRKVKTRLRRKLDADEVSTGEGINTGFTDVNTAFEEIKSGDDEVNSGDESIIPSPKKGQREGKAVLKEKSQSKRTKKQIREEQASLAKIDELELSKTQKNRMAQVQEAAKYYTEEDWDSVRAKLEANRDLSSKVLSIDFSSDDFAKKMVELINEKKRERIEEEPSLNLQVGTAPAKIVKWQILKTGKKGAYQIIREDHTDVVYVNFTGLLNDLTRDDLKELYGLMMLKYGDSRPEEEYERVLWGDLKTICVVHCLTLEAAHIYMMTEVKYPLPSRVCQAMLEKRLIGDRKDEVCCQLLKLIERQAQQIMSITKEQQQALDNALVPREQRLTIGSCNYRLSTTFKPKEPTFQVALDVLTLTPFYPAFLITASILAVYMQKFWAIVTYQKHHIRFKMNKKSYSFDMETFRNMLLICPKLPGHKFMDPLFKEEILNFIRELGYPGKIKLLSDVKVDALPQP